MLITLKILRPVRFKNVSFVVLMLKICLVFGQPKVVVIDPGHGGTDSGAIGIHGVQEKDVVLSVANQILVLNKILFDNKMDIYLTRYGDTLISLWDRGRLAKSLNVDVFVSLHCNASNTSAKGMDVYVHSTNDEDVHTKESIAMGLSVLNESSLRLGLKNRGVKFADFQVLRGNIAFRPSVLIEMGFVTNSDEAGYFLKSKNIRAMALAILMGLHNYFNSGS